MEISLELIDQLKARANISYRRAKELLEETGGDLIKALINLEESSTDTGRAYLKQGQFLISRTLRAAGKLHQKKVRVQLQEKTVAEIPVTAGALAAALFPKLAASGVIALLAAHGSMEINEKMVSSPVEEKDTPWGRGGWPMSHPPLPHTVFYISRNRVVECSIYYLPGKYGCGMPHPLFLPVSPAEGDKYPPPLSTLWGRVRGRHIRRMKKPGSVFRAAYFKRDPGNRFKAEVQRL